MFVICLFNARGDYLLNLPALRALAEVATSPTVLVVRSGARRTYLRDVKVDLVVEVDVKYDDLAYHFDSLQVSREILCIGSVDTLVSLNPWSSNSLAELTALLQPRQSVGFGAGAWTHPIPLDFTCHNVDLGFRAVKVFKRDLKPEHFSWPPAYPPEAARFARQLRDEFPLGPFVVIHRETKAPKEWDDHSWLEFLRQWLNCNPDSTVLDVSMRPLAVNDREQCWDRMLHTLGLPLEDALAVTGTADLFVGVDSCFLHAADLARVPAVGIFFTTDASEFGLRWSTHHHISAPTPDELAPAAVLQALTALEGDNLNCFRLSGMANVTATADYASRHARGRSSFRVRQGLSLSTVGLGTGGVRLERDLDAADVLVESLDLGCNVVDLAGNYADGNATGVAGHGLRRAVLQGVATRREIFLCAKAGFTNHLQQSAVARASGWLVSEHCMESEYLSWEFERQCRWLGVSSLDAFLVQNPEECLAALGPDRFRDQLRSAFELFEGFISQQRLQFYGISTAEALRVEPGNARHIDLRDLRDIALQCGGRDHGFRLIQLPMSVLRLEALELPAHTLGHEPDSQVVPALAWADAENMVVLGNSPLNGGWRLETVSASLEPVVEMPDAAARLLQFARSVPGVTTTLVGVTNPAHLSSVRTVLGEELLDLAEPLIT